MMTKRIWAILIVLLMFVFVFAGCSTTGKGDNTLELETNNILNEPIGSPSEEKTESVQDLTTEPTVEETTTIQPDEWLTFTNEEHGFTLEYPSSWIIVDPGENYGVVFRPYEGTQSTFYVDTHTSMFSDRTYDDYMNEMIGDLMRIRSDATFGEPHGIEINGYPFTALEYQGTSTDGTVYKYNSYFTANGYGYEMYYVMPEPEYEVYAPIAEKMVESFKFTK